MSALSKLFRAFGTYEATPGAMTRHRPDIQGGSFATRKAYDRDPRSSWMDEEGMDILHRELGIPQGRTRRAIGMYTPPGGELEINPAHAAPVREIDPAKMDMTEAVRSYIDAQGAGAWHGVSEDGWSDAVRVPMRSAASRRDITDAQEIGSRFGLGDVSDTGRGLTVTSFGGTDLPGDIVAGAADALADRFKVPPGRMSLGRLQSGYVGNEDAWEAPDGSGVLTRLLRERLSGPGADALLDSPEIARRAGMRLERDAEGALRGAPIRRDLQLAREITARERLRGLMEALAKGAPLPAVAGAGVIAGSGEGER